MTALGRSYELLTRRTWHWYSEPENDSECQRV